MGVWQGLVLSFAPELFGEYKGGIYSAPVNILFITGTISIYIASIIKLKIYANSSRMVNAKTRNHSKLVTAFLTIVTITSTPIIMYSALVKGLKNWIGDSNNIVLQHSLFLVANLNSSLNAFAYLKLNVKARRRLNTIIQTIALAINGVAETEV